MKWRTKARLQNLIAGLPEPLADYCYFQMQRHFGNLRSPTPVKPLTVGCQIAGAIHEQRPLTGMQIMEVGTGRSLALPILLWLLGAGSVTTVDVNRYLRPELVRSDLVYLRSNRAWLTGLLKPFGDANGAVTGRLERLLELDLQLPAPALLDQVLQLCDIRYEAPADAVTLDIPKHSLDVHLSQAVLEHVPPDDLRRILAAAVRVLEPKGLCIHWIGPCDHFQHGDASISPVNCLRFSEEEWHRLSGNRFMYMNRLRASDYRVIFEESGLEILDFEGVVDRESLALIESGGLPLDGRFQDKTAEDLATTELLVVARPKQVPA